MFKERRERVRRDGEGLKVEGMCQRGGERTLGEGSE